MSTPSSTEPTPRPWEIDWYVATADNAEEAGDTYKIGDELWRVARAIGPLRPEHDHWARWHVATESDAKYAVEAINAYDRLKKVEGLGRRVAELDEDQVRDYEQGLCFFCASGHEPIPGPRGGTTGQRSQRPIHAPDCVYAGLRGALEIE